MLRSHRLLITVSLPLFCAASLADDTQTDAAEPLAAFEASAPLSDGELNEQRARENIEIDQITINDQDNDGEVSDNIAVDNTTGDNTISSDSFTNVSGFISTVQNTGNNVLIQHSTIINVSVEPVPSE